MCVVCFQSTFKKSHLPAKMWWMTRTYETKLLTWWCSTGCSGKIDETHDIIHLIELGLLMRLLLSCQHQDRKRLKPQGIDNDNSKCLSSVHDLYVCYFCDTCQIHIMEMSATFGPYLSPFYAFFQEEGATTGVPADAGMMFII